MNLTRKHRRVLVQLWRKKPVDEPTPIVLSLIRKGLIREAPPEHFTRYELTPAGREIAKERP